MFVLSEMKDVIRVTPEHFHQSLTESITTLLNRKLANKVVLNVGLCIALFDITQIGHSYIFPGDGSSHTEVKFRYIVFRPIVEEIVIGKIRSCSREGVHGVSRLGCVNALCFCIYTYGIAISPMQLTASDSVPNFSLEKKIDQKEVIEACVDVTIGFFDDILIPVNALQHPSRFDETDQAWVWEYPKGDGEKHDLFMDSGESIRFRVTSEAFEESLPTGPPGTECPVQSIAPYRLTGGINEPGLGLLSWWEAQDQDDDGDDNEDHENDE